MDTFCICPMIKNKNACQFLCIKVNLFYINVLKMHVTIYLYTAYMIKPVAICFYKSGLKYRATYSRGREHGVHNPLQAF